MISTTQGLGVKPCLRLACPLYSSRVCRVGFPNTRIWAQKGFNLREVDLALSQFKRLPSPKTEDEEELLRGDAIIHFCGNIGNPQVPYTCGTQGTKLILIIQSCFTGPQIGEKGLYTSLWKSNSAHM